LLGDRRRSAGQGYGRTVLYCGRVFSSTRLDKWICCSDFVGCSFPLFLLELLISRFDLSHTSVPCSCWDGWDRHSLDCSWGLFFLGKFATGHRYFVAFAKTHHLIVSLPGTITIMCHICQNTPPG
jgi:hypothetical protein